MSFIIYDTSCNTGEPFINPMRENCSLEENAMTFHTKEGAEQMIKQNNWEHWAVVKKSKYPAYY